MCVTTYAKKALCLFVLSGFLISCNNTRPIKNCVTFEEMPDPTADTLSNWDSVEKGLHASWVSSDIKYPKSVNPNIKTIHISDSLVGWKGETLSTQLLLWSSENIDQIECEFGEFKSETNILPSNIAEARFVRYVMTDIFEPGCGYRKPEDFPSSLSADMLDTLDCFNMKAKTVRPVWITVQVPRNAQAGLYKSTLKVFARDQKTQNFEIELNVQDRTLPEPNKWLYHLDLWQHPAAVARTQNLKIWSDEHFDALRTTMQMLANAGQKVITTTLNKDPWNNQCFDNYTDMIIWTKNTDGTWSYDYTIFDKWVNLMMDLGVNKMINCYSIVPWNNELHYIDAATSDTINIKADPGTPIFSEIWTPFLTDFTKHLKSKNWLEITNIAMDERSPETMAATIELLQKVSPELGISLADNHKSYKKYPFIKDMSVAADAKVDSLDIIQRKQNGLTTTYYVCCSDKFPNMFTFSESAESVYSALYSYAAGYDGFLRWAFNSWVENPLTDSRFRTWPSGDTYIIYPNARSSIRFERLIEGIQDVEKIRILQNDLATTNTPESLAKLEELNKEIKLFNTIKPSEPYNLMLENGKRLINKLSQ